MIGLGKGTGGRKGKPTKWGHFTIGHNVFSDVAVNVDLKDCRGVTITGNTFWMGYEHNLKVEGCEEIVVGSNAFERNPAYDYGTSQKTQNVIEVTNCNDCVLTGLLVQGVHTAKAGVMLTDCTRCNVTACSILDCENVGLLMNNPKNCRVSDCIIRNDSESTVKSDSLKIIGGSGNQIVNNMLQPPGIPSKEPQAP